MPDIKWREMKVLNEALRMESGYVLDFSDSTMRTFFDNEFHIDIDDETYREDGNSKAKRLRCLLKKAPGPVAARVLRELWKFGAMEDRLGGRDKPDMEQRYFEVVSRLEGAEGGLARTDAIERFTTDETLDELVAAIERDIMANKPEVALDRLHTYCMKKFAHLLQQRGEEPRPKETLDARAGRYFNPLRRAGVRPITDKIMQHAVQMLSMFNHTRNNESLAHDNELVDPAEARYIFDSIVSMLRFLKSHEPSAYGT